MPSGARFEALRLELARGGVAPLYVERTLLELGEHFEDLERDALASGLGREEAERAASALLGSEQAIAAAVLARRELLRWTRRWPTVALCLRSAAALGALPWLPVVYCLGRGVDIARWGSAVGAAAMLVGSLFAWLNWIITI